MNKTRMESALAGTRRSAPAFRLFVRPQLEKHSRHACGYILFETMMAMVILSIGIIGVNKAMREAIQVRGVARDNTQARFLLEETISMLELQPQLVEGESSGKYDGDNSRFSYKWKVSKVEVPEPPIPPNLPPEEVEKFKLTVKYLAKIEVTVSWQRSGRKFEQNAQTMWMPEKIFIPEEKRTP